MRRPTLFATLTCCVLASNAAAQTDVAAITPPPATATDTSAAHVETGRLTGHILCNDTRRPARGALVTIVKVSDAQSGFGGFANMLLTHVRTDGTYLVEHLPPGNYAVFASLSGYLTDMDKVLATDPHMGASPKMRELLEQRGTVAVTSSGTSTFDLTLDRGAAISGRIFFADGSPAASVKLLVEDAKAKPEKDDTEQQQQMERAIQGAMFKNENTSTDDQGRFRLAGLRPGSYRLAATQPLWSTDPSGRNGGEEMGLAIFGVADPRALRIYAGNTVHRLDAKVLDLRAGDEVTGIDITLPLNAFHDLRGTVTAKDGRAVNMGELTLKDTADGQFVFHAALNVDGSFVVQQVPPGTYTLTASGTHIGQPTPGPAGIPARFRPLQAIAAFADGSLSVLVKDSDIDGLNLTLTEIPMPKADPVTAEED